MLYNVKILPLKFAVFNDISMLFDVSVYKNGMNCTKAHNSIVEKLVVVESMNLSISAIFKLLRCICVQGIKNTESFFMNKIERSLRSPWHTPSFILTSSEIIVKISFVWWNVSSLTSIHLSYC